MAINFSKPKLNFMIEYKLIEILSFCFTKIWVEKLDRLLCLVSSQISNALDYSKGLMLQFCMHLFSKVDFQRPIFNSTSQNK